MRSEPVKSWKSDRHLIVAAVFLLTCLIISILILSCVPPVSRDALTHHLAIPKLYIKHGGIYEIPSMSFSYYPMNLDLLYLIPVYLGNDIAPKFIHFSFALLTAWLIFGYLKSRITQAYALFGVIFFLSIPMVLKLSITAYVDLGLVFFSTGSLLTLLKWMGSGFQIRFLVFSAVLCGLGMGTKYNGLIVCLILMLLVPFIHSRYGRAGNPAFWEAVRSGLLFLGIALLVFSPWMIRNYIWTDNPVFPLFDGWMDPSGGVSRSSVSPFAFRHVIYHESWWQMALLPLRIFFQGSDGDPQYFDGKLNPFLLILPFFAFYGIRGESKDKSTEKWILLTFAILYFTFAFITSDMRIRYVSPIIPPLVILATYGLINVSRLLYKLDFQKPNWLGLVFSSTVVLVSLSLNAMYVFEQFKVVAPFGFIGGAVSRDQYIARHRAEYPAMRYINEKLSPDARILFVYMGNRGYYCDREYRFDVNNKRSTLQNLVKETGDFEKVSLGLRDLGVTHLLIYHGVFDKWVKTGFSLEGQGIIRKFFERKSRLLFFQSGYGLYELSFQPRV